MSAEELCKGVAIVIDDDIDDKNANIQELIAQIEGKNMPMVKYLALPQVESIIHLRSVSFILLDWKLTTLPMGVERSGEEEVINFLKTLKETCFVPIFIFTNEDTASIASTLEKNGLYFIGKLNDIFIKKKGELTGGKLFSEIQSWFEVNPSVMVLKEWENEYERARNQLFRDFFQINPFWPNILSSTFSDDHIDLSSALGDIISRNLRARMLPIEFKAKLEAAKEVPPSEIRMVLEGERFIRNAGLNPNYIATGDVFKCPGSKYYINIRADCDCIPDRNNPGATIDNVELYLLEGKTMSSEKENAEYKPDYGTLPELDSQAIIFSMYDGKTFDFRFKNLFKMTWSQLKDRRIGRLVPPHITRIQERYALYSHRQGLPRIPKEAVQSAEEPKAEEGKNGKEVAK